MNDFKINMNMLVGKYAIIPTGYSRDEHIYTVVSVFESNGWCEVPILHNSEIVLHEKSQTVLNVIHCGVDETKVVRVALKDCIIRQPQTQADRIRSMSDEELAEFLNKVEATAYNDDSITPKDKNGYNMDMLEWLQSEVEG